MQQCRHRCKYSGPPHADATEETKCSTVALGAVHAACMLLTRSCCISCADVLPRKRLRAQRMSHVVRCIGAQAQ